MSNYFDPKIAHHILSDNSLLTVQFVDIVWDPTHNNPEDRERGELQFLFEGLSRSRDQLPSEVTDSLIDKLVQSAVFDPLWSYGGPDQ
jgi:hypothetical protein